MGSATYIAVTAVLDPEFYAVATACQYLAQSVGQVGGLAAAGALIQSVLHKQLEVAFTDVPDAASMIHQIVNNVNSIGNLKGDVRKAVLEGYKTSLSYCHGKSSFLHVTEMAPSYN